MAVAEKAKAVGTKVNPVNTPHKRWTYYVVASPFVSAVVVKLAAEYVPDWVPVVPEFMDLLAGLL